MKSTKFIDGLISLLSFSTVIISLIYVNNLFMKIVLSVFFLINGIFFLVILLMPEKKNKRKKSINSITELVLLSEENTVIAIWELYGKTSLVIGRDYGDVHVDVNLGNTSYAGTIDAEHAVLNYSKEEWFIEDVGSKNGISIKKIDSEKKYALTANKPCKLQVGDIIYIGLTKMAIRWLNINFNK